MGAGKGQVSRGLFEAGMSFEDVLIGHHFLIMQKKGTT